MTKKEDPRIARTRHAFEQAILVLLKENDFQKITVGNIAKEAGLNRATFYLHYFDKEDLINQYIDQTLRDLREDLQIITAEFSYSSDNPHPLFIRMFEQMQDNYEFYHIMLAVKKVEEVTDTVHDIIYHFSKDANEWMSMDGIQFAVPDEISLTYVSAAYLGTMIWWLNNEMPYSPKYMASQLTRMSTIGSFVDNPFFKDNA